LANRNNNGSIGHTGKGPIKLLEKILERAKLPEDVREDLENVVFYVERFVHRH